VLDGEYLLFGVGSAMSEQAEAAIHDDLDLVRDRMRPWASERTFLNFAGRRPPVAGAFGSADYRRLQEIKAQYDPHDLFQANCRLDDAISSDS
jgi:hypothetical protein